MEISKEQFNREYKIGAFIAEGTFGKVYKLTHRNDMSPRHAVKRLRLKEDKTIRDRMIREKECLIKLDHENIVKFCGYAIISDGVEGKHFQSIK